MKHCPNCRNQYTDETLNFCLEDGTPLVDKTAKQSSIGTIAFNSSLVDKAKQSPIDTMTVSDPLTADSILRTEHPNFNSPNDANKTQSLKEISNDRTALQSETRKSNFLPYALSAGLLLLFVSGGIGGWFYLDNQNKSSARDSVVSSSLPENKEKSPRTDQSFIVEKLALEKSAQEPTDADREQIKKEITAVVEDWKRLAEARDLSGFSSKYAETVDFYEKDGAKLAQVRSEIQKIFTTYEQINITLTDIKVAVNAAGDEATAVFDREWEYENSKDLSEGKAHTKLHFQKNGKEWKIVGEKYLKIYDMENWLRKKRKRAEKWPAGKFVVKYF